MVDVFDEVEEQLRTERYKALALKALPWVAGVLVAALVIGLAVWGWQAWRKSNVDKASTAYAEALEAAQGGDRAATLAAFERAADAGSPVYEALALMHQGAVRLDQGRPAEAAELFDRAAKAAPSGKAGLVVADSARLKSAFALMDTAPYADIETRLKPLTQDERPFRLQAKEALAMAKLAHGQTEAAKSDFVVLSLTADAPQALRERSKAAADLIDSGVAASLPAVLKAAAALPAVPPQTQNPAGAPQ